MIPIFTTIYDRVLLWSGHRHAERYLFGISMAESVFFPIPPDVMLAPMVLAKRDRAWWLAGLTTVASVIGGLIGYLLGYLALEAIFPLIEQAGYAPAYAQAVDAFKTYGIGFVILAGFSPIPFKLITVAAGALGMPLIGFLAGCIVGRGARFFMVAGIIYAGGARAAEHLRAWVDRIGWAVVGLVAIVAILWLAGCAATVPAPVVHKAGLTPQSHLVAPASYTVEEGESLYSISFRYGLDWQEVAAWNGITAPYTLREGDQLRLRRPVGRRPAVSRQLRQEAPSAGIDTRPLSPQPKVEPKPAGAPVNAVLSPASPDVETIEAVAGNTERATRLIEGIRWQWPIDGSVTKPFDPKATRRGLGIQGMAGEQVLAAGAGEVVYSGRALIGYGELIIIKHSDVFFSAYGYNKERLVEEGVRVEAGAPIALIGQSIDGEWLLHFEIRRNGEPIDPRAYLPTVNQ